MKKLQGARPSRVLPKVSRLRAAAVWQARLRELLPNQNDRRPGRRAEFVQHLTTNPATAGPMNTNS